MLHGFLRLADGEQGVSQVDVCLDDALVQFQCLAE